MLSTQTSAHHNSMCILYSIMNVEPSDYKKCSVAVLQCVFPVCIPMAEIEKIAFLLALSLVVVARANVASSVSPLKFLLMVDSESTPTSSAVVSAVNQTLEEINANDILLPEHRLEYLLRDTKVYSRTINDNV